jgi:hypothetical protein
LQTVTKCVPLPHNRVDFHRSKRQHELQLHEVADRSLKPQHDRNSRLADVHGLAFEDSTAAGCEGNIDDKLEARLVAGIDENPGLAGGGLTLALQNFPSSATLALISARKRLGFRPTCTSPVPLFSKLQ